jgi:hypothetical protein
MKRNWNLDGRVLTAEDARQVVKAYRNYSPKRFAWLMIQASNHGHKPEIAEVFRQAIPPQN